MSEAAVVVPEAEVPEVAMAVQTRRLRKRYGSLFAVDELNLQVPAGSVFGLIGPNGAGKTTTFEILATLLQPTSGTASIFGKDPVKEPEEVRKMLGFMPDFFGVYDDVRVEEYLDFFARAYRLEAAHRKRATAELLELVDLTHKRDAFVESLSRGMKQRLGLARALVHDPSLLILDEPASGLDPRARVELRELIVELRRMGKTIVISSHILTELKEMCTDVAILEAGRLIVQGDPNEIVSGIAGARAFRTKLVDAAHVPIAQKILESLPGIAKVTVVSEDPVVEFYLTGDDEAVADVGEALTAGGARMVELTETRMGLEELFMDVTKGIVQ